MNKQQKFILALMQDAIKAEKETGMSRYVFLTIGALETDYLLKIKGKSLFGIKFNEGDKTNKIKYITTEYLNTPNYKPKGLNILSVQKVEENKWKYTLEQYFRDYDTYYEAMVDFFNFIFANKRYTEARKHISNPDKFFEEIALAGYATGSGYAKLLKDVHWSIKHKHEKTVTF